MTTAAKLAAAAANVAPYMRATDRQVSAIVRMAARLGFSANDVNVPARLTRDAASDIISRFSAYLDTDRKTASLNATIRRMNAREPGLNLKEFA